MLAASAAPAQDAKAKPVPFRLTNTQHIMVRAKINGEGPFNFVVDTGCPVLIITKEAGKQAKLDPAKTLVTLDRFDLEGGLSQTKVPALVLTPFQLEGMNAMGFPGVELHGLLGYTVIAKYKMDIDFTRSKMYWTPLEFDPKKPKSSGKGGSTGLEMLGTVMKMMAALSGMKPPPPPTPRGFWGLEFDDAHGAVRVKSVLANSPADVAGFRAGDVLLNLENKDVKSLAEFRDRTANFLPEYTVRLDVRRGEETKSLKIVIGSGL
jgi:hypothetical protein